MATGEGKSLLAVFLAVLAWARGNQVTIITHRASLAVRDANVFAPLFSNLGIESRHLTADNYRFNLFLMQLFSNQNKAQESEFDGIYYAEFNDISLIRQQRLHRQRHHQHVIYY